MVLAFDVGGTDLKYGVVNSKGHIKFKDKVKSPHTRDGLYGKIKDIYDELSEKFEIEGIGISMPGIIDESGFLVTAGALLDLYQTPMQEDLNRILDVPVFVENDANCATYAEKWVGHGEKYENFALMVVGTGIGGGLVINNKLVRGRQYATGEYGFMLFGENPYNNDNLKSWSELSAVRSGLVNKYKELTGEMIDGIEIYKRKEQGDESALICVNELYESLGRGIFNLIVALDPDVILIGGAISANEEFIEGIRAVVRRLLKSRKDMIYYSLPEIMPSKFYNDSGIIGAAYLVYM